ncbi:MAG: glycosyltransferase [Butyrivibrio sp.]|nr:glycosyltransferase [Butyrivibrio sp.]
MLTVDVIIPTYKPNDEFIKLMDMLEKQLVMPKHIILINTEKKIYDEFLNKHPGFEERYSNLLVKHVTKEEFNHGGTRNLGASISDADCFLFMTQDAIPKDFMLISNLLKALEDETVAAAYARQYPRPECNLTERYNRKFNYPAESMRKTQADKEKLGIKTYFCSNVCAMYRRDIFEKLGGFINKTIFNEDMIYAGTAMQAGYAVCYVAEAAVVHSHNYTCMQQFHRNFDLGVSQIDHPEIFGDLKSENEGIKMVKRSVGHFAHIGKHYLIPNYILLCASRWLGYKLGRNYKKLPKWLINACTMNKQYWKQI